jgi:hypothetical protein
VKGCACFRAHGALTLYYVVSKRLAIPRVVLWVQSGHACAVAMLCAVGAIRGHVRAVAMLCAVGAIRPCLCCGHVVCCGFNQAMFVLVPVCVLWVQSDQFMSTWCVCSVALHKGTLMGVSQPVPFPCCHAGVGKRLTLNNRR